MAASGSNLEAVSGVLSTVVAVPSQVTSDARATAVGVTAQLAAGGTALTSTASASILAALSSVSDSELATLPAADAGGGARRLQQSGASCPTLGSVPAVLATLAASHAAGLSVPGEPAVTTSSSLIAMSVSLDGAVSNASVGSGGASASRLFSQPLSAPGSNASFAPLPPGLFSSAGA